MLVRCMNTNKTSLPKEIQENYSSDDNSLLILGKEYVVYSLAQFYCFIGYWLFEEEKSSIPLWYPSNYFEITNPRLSRYWMCALKKERNIENSLFFSFPEWINDDYFYGSLVDGEEKEVKIFRSYKNLMDLEFPDNSISKRAQVGDEKWLICPECMDAWESSDERDAMVICPKCKKMFHNPRYKDPISPIENSID